MSSKRFRIQMTIKDNKKGPEEADVLTDIAVGGVRTKHKNFISPGLRWRTFGDRQHLITVKHLLRLSGRRILNTLHDWGPGCCCVFPEEKRTIVKY